MTSHQPCPASRPSRPTLRRRRRPPLSPLNRTPIVHPIPPNPPARTGRLTRQSPGHRSPTRLIRSCRQIRPSTNYGCNSPWLLGRRSEGSSKLVDGDAFSLKTPCTDRRRAISPTCYRHRVPRAISPDKGKADQHVAIQTFWIVVVFVVAIIVGLP